MSKRPGRRFPGASSLAPVLEHAFGRAVIPLGKWLTRGGVTVSEGTSVNPARENLSATWKYPRRTFPGGTGSDPVVSASRSTAAASASDGRLSTHSLVRSRFWVVWERTPRPSTARQPSQNADDIGARLAEPSSLVLEIRTTGVPKYRMPGSMGVCATVFTLSSLPSGETPRWRESATVITGATVDAGDHGHFSRPGSAPDG